MQWIKASIETVTEGVEPVLGVLLSCGINGVQIIDSSELRKFLKEEPLQWDYVDEALLNDESKEVYIEFYVTPDIAGRETLTTVRSQLAALAEINLGIDLGGLELKSESVDDEAWLNEWKKHYKPFKIGKSVVVVPVWEKYDAQPGEIIFTIDPGSVFGTGLHQTTQLCVEAMEEYIKPGDVMMDVGCGSGILSVIGLMLGADSVFACDIDPAAAIATRENALRNPVDPDTLSMMTGNIFTDEKIISAASGKKCDAIVANIVADVIIKLAPIVKEHLKPGGFFIASGIIDERVDDVESALVQNGYRLKQKLQRDGWFCMVALSA